MKVSRVVASATGLLFIFALLSLSSKLHNCNTFDESAHLTNGASFWVTGDLRLAPEAMLLQRWLSLPLVLGDYHFPYLAQRDWWISNNWGLARQYFFELGNDANAMIRAGRTMNLVLTVALGLAIFSWSRRLFGTSGGFISLVAFCFCPTLLAHGSLATPDVGTALFFMLSLAALWRMLYRITPWSVLASLLAVAGLFVCKMSGVLIIPIGLILLGIRLIDSRPLLLGFSTRCCEISSRRLQAVCFAGLLVLHVLAAWVVIWTLFGFRYEIFRESVPGRDAYTSGTWEEAHQELGGFAGVIDWARANRVLPEAYLYAFANTLRLGRGVNPAFLNGQVGVGWVSFFPYCFLVKTPMPTLALFAMAVVLWLLTWWKARGPDRQVLAECSHRSLPLWILFAVYWTAALNTRINIGQRHLIPIYPAVLVSIGALGMVTPMMTRPRQLVVRVATAVLLATLVVESLATWPNYLSYFNALAGGSRNGYRHLVDSSLDWGQDLPGLRDWLRANGGTAPVYLAYFGTAKPEYYGIHPTMYFPSYEPRPQPKEPLTLRPGIYCISATMLQPVYRTPHEPWNAAAEQGYRVLNDLIEQYHQTEGDDRARADLLNKTGLPEWELVFHLFEQARFGRLCAYLLQQDPDASVGGSILIYRLDGERLRAALREPL